jgi:hypothetical protein
MFGEPKGGGMVDLTQAIEAFNQGGGPQIEVGTRRDGRVVAKLPRVGREIIIEGSQFNHDVKVTVEGIALLCEEARLAFAPGLALLEAGLAAIGELSGPVGS